MTKLFVSAVLVLTASFAQAATHPHQDICGLEMLEDGSEAGLYTETQVLDIKYVNSVSDENMQMLKKYYSYTSQEEVTFAELQKRFAKGGEEDYNDLYIFKFEIKASGAIYYEVRTYPGDTAVGVVFDHTTKNIVATNGDGEYTLFVNGKPKVSCYKLNQGK